MNNAINAMNILATIYYSVYEIDLPNNTLREFDVNNIISDHLRDVDDATTMMHTVMTHVAIDKYREAAVEFVDLKTIAERMRGKKQISAEFIGMNIGWFKAQFISFETDERGCPTRLLYITEGIDEQKRREEIEMMSPFMDELSGCYNRKAYEMDVQAVEDLNQKNDCVYVAMDVNGLKMINDGYGHAAGDELILGASTCMLKVFGKYGRVYRVGGDEFIALIHTKEASLEDIKAEFETVVSSWRGDYVESMSISCGYVETKEFPDCKIAELAKTADQRMYNNKDAYYKNTGMDRRGRTRDYSKVSDTYTRVLKANLTNDMYEVVKVNRADIVVAREYDDKQLSAWFRYFVEHNPIIPEDREIFEKKINVSYLREFFKNKKDFVMTVRTELEGVQKDIMIELLPTNEYSEDNQLVFLYTKEICN